MIDKARCPRSCLTMRMDDFLDSISTEAFLISTRCVLLNVVEKKWMSPFFQQQRRCRDIEYYRKFQSLQDVRSGGGKVYHDRGATNLGIDCFLQFQMGLSAHLVKVALPVIFQKSTYLPNARSSRLTLNY